MKLLVLALKIGVTCAFLSGLLYVIGSGDFFDKLVNMALPTILQVVGVYFLGIAIQAFRFQRVLRAGGIQQSWFKTLRVQMMGIFVNQFLPGMFGGDVIRASYWVPDYPGRKSFLASVVFYERLMGLFTLLILALGGGTFMALANDNLRWIILVVLLFLLILTVMFFLYNLTKKGAGKMRLLHISYSIFKNAKELFAKKQLTGIVLLLSIFSQVMTIFMYWFLLQGLGVNLGISMITVAVTLSWLTGLLPVSLNGLGIREGSLSYLLWTFGVHHTEAATVALMAIGPMLLFASIGGVIFVFDPIKIKVIKKEIQAAL